MRKKSKLVCGVGINDVEYAVTKYEDYTGMDGKQKKRAIWVCPFYRKWKDMLMRCYYEKYQESHSTYIGCSVCKEWLTFSNFKAWMEKQDWEGKQLDKDIIFIGNKIYSAETCVFVDKRVNSFLLECNSSRGGLPIGVSLSRRHNKFKAVCSIVGRAKHLGLFDTELEAHKAWLAFKLEQAKILAAEQSDPRVAKALIERYENYVVEECDKS